MQGLKARRKNSDSVDVRLPPGFRPDERHPQPRHRRSDRPALVMILAPFLGLVMWILLLLLLL